MAERDVLGRTVVAVGDSLTRLREQMVKRVPYGPARAQMSAREMRLELQRMEAGPKLEFQREIGLDEWERFMEALYGGS